MSIRTWVVRFQALRSEARDIYAVMHLQSRIRVLEREKSWEQDRANRFRDDAREQRNLLAVLKAESFRDLQALTGIKAYVTTQSDDMVSKRVIRRMLDR